MGHTTRVSQSIMTVEDMETIDFGKYICKAKNQHGETIVMTNIISKSPRGAWVMFWGSISVTHQRDEIQSYRYNHSVLHCSVDRLTQCFKKIKTYPDSIYEYTYGTFIKSSCQKQWRKDIFCVDLFCSNFSPQERLVRARTFPSLGL